MVEQFAQNHVRYRKRQRVVNDRLRNRIVDRKQQRKEEKLDNEETVQMRSFYQFAGFWMRVWAFLLDSLTVFALNGIFVYPLLRMTGIGEWMTIASYSTQALLTALVFFLYFAIMTKKYGQTIGKMVFGLRVIAKNGQGLTWTQILFREGVGRFIHQVFFFLQVLYVAVAFTAKKQGLHDMIADTYVIHEREEFDLHS